jgi:hypothetical protein
MLRLGSIGTMALTLLACACTPMQQSAGPARDPLIDQAPMNADSKRQAQDYFSRPNSKAFAFAPGPGTNWHAWDYGSTEEARQVSVGKCEELTGQRCVLFALNDEIVWRPDAQPDEQVTAAETGVERHSRMCRHLVTTRSSTLYEECVADLIRREHRPGPYQAIDTSQVDVERYKDVLTRNIKDPSSVQFRDVYVPEESEAGLPAICGEYNAKNSYGAYVGFQRFAVRRLASGETTPLTVSTDDPTISAILFNEWRKLCDQS